MKLRTLTATLGILALTAAPALAMPNGAYTSIVKADGYTLKGICQFTPIPNELGSEAVMLCLNLASASGCNSNIGSSVLDDSDIVGVPVNKLTVDVQFTVNSGKCPYPNGQVAEMTYSGNLHWTPDDNASAPPISATLSDGVTGSGSTFTRN